MAEKVRLFLDHRALELILTTSEPQWHKCIGQSVRGFDNAIWERERENAVLAGRFCQVFAKSGDETPPLGHW